MAKIENYEGDFKAIPYFRKYAINEKGVVISLKTKKPIKHKTDVYGGKKVLIRSDEGQPTTRTVSKLVEQIHKIRIDI